MDKNIDLRYIGEFYGCPVYADVSRERIEQRKNGIALMIRKAFDALIGLDKK